MISCQHKDCQREALEAAKQVCADLGVNFTDHRRRVFEIIWQNHKAITASEIMEILGNKQPPITYRALDFLKEVGLIHHITSLNAYVGCLHPKNTDHIGQMLVCTSCRDVVEIVPEGAIKVLQKEARAAGFMPDSTHVEMLGICEKCDEAR